MTFIKNAISGTAAGTASSRHRDRRPSKDPRTFRFTRTVSYLPTFELATKVRGRRKKTVGQDLDDAY